jgi:hypothetical protein
VSGNNAELLEPKIPNLLLGVRALVGPAFIIGGWQLMAFSCPVGAIVVFCGFTLCLAEIIWEPRLLSKPYQLQVALIGATLLLADLFAISVVLPYSPLTLSTLGSQIDYSLGGGPTPGGIEWRPFYTELDLLMTNPTDGNYDDVDMLVRPDYPVAAIAQLSNLPGVSFEDKYGVHNRATAKEVGANTPPAIMSFLATNAGYKVHCNRIPPNSSLTIVMAIVELKPSQTVKAGTPIAIPDVNAFTPDSLGMEETFSGKDGTFFYRFGNPKWLSLYVPNPKPKKVLVSGYYTVGGCRRGMTKDVNVWWGKEDAR